MKYLTFFLGLFGFGLSAVFGQTNAAELVDQRFNNDQVLQIYYQVKEKNSYVVSLKTDDEDIQPSPENVQGVGTITASGIGYESVTWYFADDGYTRAQIESLNLTVIAYPTGKGVVVAPDPNESQTNNLPRVKDRSGRSNTLTYIGLGAIGAGAGLGLLGYLQYGGAQEDYDIYKNDLYPDSETFGAKPRDQFYEDANNAYLSAQIKMYAGGGLALIGGILMVANARKNANANSGRVQLKPWENIAQVQIPENPLGMGVRIRF
ncbi:MAG: hypothetical protein AAF587_14950 [Bacteroidota bacterium]